MTHQIEIIQDPDQIQVELVFTHPMRQATNCFGEFDDTWTQTQIWAFAARK